MHPCSAPLMTPSNERIAQGLGSYQKQCLQPGETCEKVRSLPTIDGEYSGIRYEALLAEANKESCACKTISPANA